MPGRPGCHGGRRRDTRTLPLSTTLPEEDFVRRNSGSADSTILPTGDDYVAEGDRAPSRAGRGPISSGYLSSPTRPEHHWPSIRGARNTRSLGRIGRPRHGEALRRQPSGSNAALFCSRGLVGIAEFLLGAFRNPFRRKPLMLPLTLDVLPP